MGHAATVTTRLELDIHARLQTLASKHGRSLDEEVRAILEEAVRNVPAEAASEETSQEYGLGTRISALFAGTGYGFREGEVVEIRNANWKFPDLGE